MLNARAQAVLDAWFGTPDSAEFGHPVKAWFKKVASLDAMFHERFGTLLEMHWKAGLPRGPLHHSARWR